MTSLYQGLTHYMTSRCQRSYGLSLDDESDDDDINSTSSVFDGRWSPLKMFCGWMALADTIAYGCCS